MINQITLVDKPNKFYIANGTIEILKWLALFLMTLDHYNKYVYNGTIPYFSELGRLAMPLFSFVFAYNLARPDTLKNKVYQRVLTRLFIIGLISCIPYIALGTVKFNFWPLNIIFTLFFSCLIIFLLEKKNNYHLSLALVVFVLSGAIIEFWWPELMMTITAWYYCRTLDNKYLYLWIMATASLMMINHNLYALFAFPLIYLATRVNINFPRWKNAFYVYYPAHLSVIWLMTHKLI